MSTVSYLQQTAVAHAARLQLRKLRHPARAIEAVVLNLQAASPGRKPPPDAAVRLEQTQGVLQNVNTLYILLVAQGVAEGLERTELASELAREVETQQRTQARLTPHDWTTLKTSAEELAETVRAAAAAAGIAADNDTGSNTAAGAAVAQLLRDLYEELLALEWTASSGSAAAGSLKRTNSRRRKHGAYYTPLPVARQIAERALAPLLALCTDAAAVQALRILDPMMGPGVFLQAGGEMLVERAAALSGQPAEQLWPAMAGQCLYGVDLDGDAARIGAVALAFLSGAPLRGLHCRAGNSLVGSVRPEVDVVARVNRQLQGLRAERLVAAPDVDTLPEPFLNWARVFPEVFGGAREGRKGVSGRLLSGGFDVLLSNPPYVSFYSRDSAKKSAGSIEEEFFNHSGVLDAPLPPKLHGRTNLFLLALFAGEQLLTRELASGRVAGRAAWLLPDTFLSNESYAEWRRFFLEADRLEAVEWIRGDLFGEPSLGSSVIYCGDARTGTVAVDLHERAPAAARSAAAPRGRPRKKAAAASAVAAVSEAAGTGGTRREEFAVAEILQFPHLVIPTMPRGTRSMVARIEAASVPVTSWMNVRDGVNPGPREFRDRILLREPDPADTSVRELIVGGDIEPFGVKASTRWIRHNPRLLTPAIRKQGASFRAQELFEGPKIVSRQTASHPIAGLDLQRRSAINSVHIMIPNESLGLDAQPARALLMILGTLNAAALTWYYRQRWMENRRVFPQVHISSLRQLPIPAVLRDAAAAERLAQAAGAAVLAVDNNEALHRWLQAADIPDSAVPSPGAARQRVDRLVLDAWQITTREWEQAA